MFSGVCYAVIKNEIIVNFRPSRLLFIFLLLFFLLLFVFADIAAVAVTTQVNWVWKFKINSVQSWIMLGQEVVISPSVEVFMLILNVCLKFYRRLFCMKLTCFGGMFHYFCVYGPTKCPFLWYICAYQCVLESKGLSTLYDSIIEEMAKVDLLITVTMTIIIITNIFWVIIICQGLAKCLMMNSPG